jgi:hypothetical protein
MISMQLTTKHIFLFLGTLMYLGTGWPLILFSFPLASNPCPDNYYKQFVPQVSGPRWRVSSAWG